MRHLGLSLGMNKGGGAGEPPTPAAPANVALPVISGAEYTGKTLTVSTGTWAGWPSPTFTYQWQAATVDISGATSDTYVLTASEEGDTITCEVTATNSEGSAMAESAATSAITAQPWEVLVIAGQSNGSGRGLPLDALGLDAPNDEIKQWETEPGQTGELIDAVEYLTAADGGDGPGGNGIGFGLTLAKQYLANRADGKLVVLLNVSVGATTLVGGLASWGPGGASRSAALTRIAEVAAAMPAGSAFRGIWWSQGESDAIASVTTDQYLPALGALIDVFRASSIGGVPFVSLGMVPSWVEAGRAPIDEALENVPALRENAAYVVGDDTGNNNDIHYDAVQQRANGVNLYSALATAEANTSGNVGTPTAPTISSAASTTYGEIDVTFAVTGPLELYSVQHKRRAATSWTTDLTVYGDNVSGAYTITSLTAGDYDVRIVATNFVGDTASTVSQVDAVTGDAPFVGSMLLESGDYLLLESGDQLLLEPDTGSEPPAPSADALLLESGDYLLLESGDRILLEV